MFLKTVKINIILTALTLSFSIQGRAADCPSSQSPCGGYTDCNWSQYENECTCSGTTKCSNGCWIVGTYQCNGDNWIGVLYTNDNGTYPCGGSCPGAAKGKTSEKLPPPSTKPLGKNTNKVK